ncbi:hypothetical protein KIPB_006110 [Kipferlia bialata]|uniref:Uncharacterized protein n=1 Tax=Kipferlia bialata TaxID=797122 RepID=A0A391NM34_9EUKA|nr:hypothetical protein KIPB_003121 [Kipferlia bialata]GCA62837.1 hypothetical protein KIPB_006110 [Kipferlia bialata]|eukprot:g3121.t1
MPGRDDGDISRIGCLDRLVNMASVDRYSVAVPVAVALATDRDVLSVVDAVLPLAYTVAEALGEGGISVLEDHVVEVLCMSLGECAEDGVMDGLLGLVQGVLRESTERDRLWAQIELVVRPHMLDIARLLAAMQYEHGNLEGVLDEWISARHDKYLYTGSHLSYMEDALSSAEGELLYCPDLCEESLDNLQEEIQRGKENTERIAREAAALKERKVMMEGYRARFSWFHTVQRVIWQKGTELEVNGVNIGPEGGKAVAVLDQMPQLKKLCLRGTLIGDEGAVALAKTLPLLKDLELLALGQTVPTTSRSQGNNIGETGAVALAVAIPQLPKLIKFSLNGSPIGPEGLSAIGPVLPERLQQLALCSCSLGHEGGASLATALARLPNLEMLILSDNMLGHQAGRALAESLQTMTLLTNLDLGNNLLGNGGVAIGRALTNLPLLTTLDLVLNKMGPDAAIAVAESLPSLTHLTYLSLGASPIGSAGGMAIGNQLHHLPALKTLELCICGLRAPAAKVIAAALPHLPALEKLDLHCNIISKSGLRAIKAKALPGLEVVDYAQCCDESYEYADPAESTQSCCCVM